MYTAGSELIVFRSRGPSGLHRPLIAPWFLVISPTSHEPFSVVSVAASAIFRVYSSLGPLQPGRLGTGMPFYAFVLTSAGLLGVAREDSSGIFRTRRGIGIGVPRVLIEAPSSI